jgi:hypothetical protein
MPRPLQAEILMRLVVQNPVPGVAHSLQDRDSKPVDAKRSTSGEPIFFEFSVRASPGPRFHGDHVRNGGGVRRFVYIALGKQAGDSASCWDRRMKIDIHTIPQAILDDLAPGGRIEGTVCGTGADGSPACATVPIRSWRAA